MCATCVARAQGDVASTVLAGKVAQATLLAWHSYAEQDEFREKTGLTNARLLDYPPEDTQVLLQPYLRSCTVPMCVRPCR